MIRALTYILVLLISLGPALGKSTVKPTVKLGVDILLGDGCNSLSGMRYALLTNFSGRTGSGELTADALIEKAPVKPAFIFTPEHGLFSNIKAGDKVEDAVYRGVAVRSLYGSDRKPRPEWIKGLDAIVVDIQDIGVRSYTYLSTVYLAMQAAAEAGVKFIVLDRPNPIGGAIADGAVMPRGRESFVGIVPISYVHGCTIGELAAMINGENWLGKELKCDLEIIKMKGWRRSMSWEDTGLTWFSTSPNIPSVDAARGAACIGILGELGTMSVGIGTAFPFQYLGDESLSPEEVSTIAGKLDLPGIKLIPTQYKSQNARPGDPPIVGFQIQFYLSNSFKPYSAGLELASELAKIKRELFDTTRMKKNSIEMFNKVTGDRGELLGALSNPSTSGEALKWGSRGLPQYLKLRSKYLLYE